MARGFAGRLGLRWRARVRSRGGPSLLELLIVPGGKVSEGRGRGGEELLPDDHTSTTCPGSRWLLD